MAMSCYRINYIEFDTDIKKFCLHVLCKNPLNSKRSIKIRVDCYLHINSSGLVTCDDIQEKLFH